MNKNKIDVVQAFEIFIAFQGDEVKTAAALQLNPEDVRALALSESWSEKIKRWNLVTDSDYKASQIALNRGIQYVLGSRLRALIDKVVLVLSEGDAQNLVDKLTVHGPHGSELKTRPLCDLVKAAESAALICSRALGDTADERAPQQQAAGKNSIALSVLAALNAAENLDVDSVKAVTQSLATPNDDTGIPPV